MVENWLKIAFLVIWHDFCTNKNIFGNGAGMVIKEPVCYYRYLIKTAI